ncbi:FAD-binding oxidoreductase [Flavobacterium sp. NKUCC04_CG]|uniref:NAD(P)/FAD-dependent oxidoreductase n=1 Tax=Flavobacterium sp. NKUCC04_CG TaxID=2842121 RepID=UPI001C5AB31B|nr:FAD-dependent oxidoreductase [Flavobacterium sp. NKUCC04_CG]MBW3518552.1 FAD-binding oxidoreductase [Flavobacterium sp. NKUCC04_CG]
MDLHSGLPFWIAKNALYDYYNPLKRDIQVSIAIIGSGITGALVANELCDRGISCTVFDRRTPATGSTIASTAQLQYEIDVPLSQLIKDIGEEKAVAAYKASLQSITDLEQTFEKLGIDPDFKRVPTLFLADSRKGAQLIKAEYKARDKHGLPVRFIDDKELKSEFNIVARGGLYNDTSAQMDSYKAATQLLEYRRKKNQLELFTHTEIIDYKKRETGYDLITTEGHFIRCKYVIIAAGFEAGRFLPKPLMKLESTYAVISQPVEDAAIWKERCLIWNTANPYFYMRTTKDNRIIIGGEDVPFKDPIKRDQLIRTKKDKLVKQFKALFPQIDFVPDMTWCGTFSSTKDGLPIIGKWPGNDKMLFALGYGGNGITFSMIAAQMLVNQIEGIEDNREELFELARLL